MLVCKKCSVKIVKTSAIPYTVLSIGNEDQCYEIKYNVYKNNILIFTFSTHSSNILDIENDVCGYNFNPIIKVNKFIKIIESLELNFPVLNNFINYLKNI